jgi:hypothetical protein
MAINQLKALIVSDPIEQKYIQEIHRLNAECLKKEIIEIRGEYFGSPRFCVADEVEKDVIIHPVIAVANLASSARKWALLRICRNPLGVTFVAL